MFALLLLTAAAAWMAWDLFRDWSVRADEDRRRARKAALRRDLLSRSPESASAHEMLGDALREAGEVAEAVAAYEEALRLRAAGGPGAEAGAGWVPGGGLENKLRLARFELAQEAAPEEYGQTLATRPQVCRTCGNLSGPRDETCAFCGAPLPVEGFLDTLRRRDHRRGIAAEVGSLAGKSALVAVAALAASWLPWEVRGAVIIAAVIVVPFRLLKKVGPD